jgi:hypothetical protein
MWDITSENAVHPQDQRLVDIRHENSKTVWRALVPLNKTALNAALKRRGYLFAKQSGENPVTQLQLATNHLKSCCEPSSMSSLNEGNGLLALRISRLIQKDSFDIDCTTVGGRSHRVKSADML